MNTTNQLLQNTANLQLEEEQLNLALDEIRSQFLKGEVVEGMDTLLPLLRGMRLGLSETDWNRCVEFCLRHPLRELLHQDPFTYRAFAKPRGYAGDAPLLDYLYGLEEGWPIPEGTTELGAQIFQYTTRSDACEGVRARRGFIADLLDDMVDEVPQPQVLSLASGHLREAELSAAVKRRKFKRLVALDADAASLAEVTRCYGRHGVEVQQVRVRELLTGRFQIGSFDLIYSTGLFDYLTQSTGQRLISSLFQVLLSRGRLLVANFMPGIADVGYMESYMGWKLIYREREEMLRLLQEIPQSEIRDIRLFAEEKQNIMFLQVTRN